MAGNQGNNRIVWSEEMDNFLIKNFDHLTNQQLADSLGLKITSVRHRCYSMGLKRINLEYWTDEQVALLKKLWKTRGDSEIAEEFAKRWHKDKGWSKKHIEKKRRQLGLKRTEEMRLKIHSRNKRLGRWAECAVKAWKHRDINPDGTIVYWLNNTTKKPMPMIKVEGLYVHYARHRWKQLGRKIKRGHNIILNDGDPFNLSDDNLVMLSNAELAQRNSLLSSVGLSDNYVAGMLFQGKKNKDLRKEIILKHPELIELKKQQLTLNRELKSRK